MTNVTFENVPDYRDPVCQLRASIQFKDSKYISMVCVDMCVLSGDYGFRISDKPYYKDVAGRLISKGIIFFEMAEYIFIPSSCVQYLDIIIEKT